MLKLKGCVIVANIQLPEALFFDLVRFHCFGIQDNAESIKSALEGKLDALVARQYYTTYKTAPTAEEREKARQQYLDIKGMRESFRW